MWAHSVRHSSIGALAAATQLNAACSLVFYDTSCDRQITHVISKSHMFDMWAHSVRDSVIGALAVATLRNAACSLIENTSTLCVCGLPA